MEVGICIYETTSSMTYNNHNNSLSLRAIPQVDCCEVLEGGGGEEEEA